ncbi:MAG TPA: hypothetical protein VM261_22065 [Kofleriaceae bacterium]|nr:hypothetical protein [Kofleriaceae bacterium]
MKKLALGLAPIMALALIAVWSTCRAVGAGAGVPDDRAWAAASAAVRKEHAPGQLIVFAPRWIDPVGRMHLGDLIPVEMAARMDADRYGVIWELGIRGARAPETRGLRPAWQKSFGGVVVRRFERAPAEVVSDLVAIAAASPGALQTSGLFSRGPQVVLAEVGFEPHRCVQLVPSPGQEVTVTFPAVALGSQLVGAVGLADVFTRRDVRTPIELIVQVDTREVARATAGVNSGWVRWRGTTTPGTGNVTIIARALGGAKARDRLVCFAAEARR